MSASGAVSSNWSERFDPVGGPSQVMDDSRDDARLLRPGEVAEVLGVPQGTLANWRYQGLGPTYVKVGRHVRYRHRTTSTPGSTVTPSQPVGSVDASALGDGAVVLVALHPAARRAGRAPWRLTCRRSNAHPTAVGEPATETCPADHAAEPSTARSTPASTSSASAPTCSAASGPTRSCRSRSSAPGPSPGTRRPPRSSRRPATATARP